MIRKMTRPAVGGTELLPTISKFHKPITTLLLMCCAPPRPPIYCAINSILHIWY